MELFEQAYEEFRIVTAKVKLFILKNQIKADFTTYE